jgi:type IV pilus assembly protein PilA
MTDAPEQATPRRKAATLFWAAGIIVVIFFFLAAIATPKFVGFQCRSKQSEAKGNLKALYVAEEAYRESTKTYSGDLARIGFSARGGRHYLFGFLPITSASQLSDASSPLVGRLKGEEMQRLLARAVARPTAFTAFAVANIDSDETLDVWTISQDSVLTNLVSDCAD